MPIAHFTDGWVRTVTVPTRTDFYDDVTPGFVLRVAPSGRKTWAVVYSVPRGVDAEGRTLWLKRRLTLAKPWPTLSLGDARKDAKDALRKAGDGDDPALAKQEKRTVLTFDTLADHYIEEYARPRKRTWREDARQLRTFCRPLWRTRAASAISRADVRSLLADVARARGGTSANRLRSCLSKLFRWSVAQGFLDVNPAAGLPAPAAEHARERVLTDDELKRLWAELDAAAARPDDDPKAIPPAVALWLKLRILTGQRGDMTAAMQWADVDLDAGVWEVPAALMKGKRPHVVPLAPVVVELLRAWRAQQPSDAVYVLEGGRARAVRAGFTTKLTSVPNWQPRDLRRTAATGMARLGTPRFIVARVLAHADPSITSVYDRFEYLSEKRKALTQWADHVAALVKLPRPKPARVVRMPRARVQ